MKEELAVIKDIHIGNRDVGSPCLWFTVEMACGSALQVLSWNKAYELIKESGYKDFRQLDGKPCIVESSGSVVKFKRLK